MATTGLDGEIFYNLLKNGYRRLKTNEDYIDRLNVFPVPDGDTGKNMGKTLEGGITASEGKKNIGEMTASLSRGSLLSARGNSGVILSQYIRGLAGFAKGKDTVPVCDFASMLESGAASAYRAVRTPTEGTMLTVMRETAEWASGENFDSFEDCFGRLIPVMRESLEKTPDKLPVLKEAGVVDSGGAGLLKIFEGMNSALMGETDADVCNVNNTTECVSEQIDSDAASKPMRHKKFAVVSTAPGKGIAGYFIGIGADAIVDGGQTDNPSAEDFIRAFDSVNADNIIVLPNNSNIKLAARQAAELYGKVPVTVIPTSSVAEGYSALSMMDDSKETTDEFVECMTSCLSGVTSLYITTATRDAFLNGEKITAGEYIALDGDRILCCRKNRDDAFFGALEALGCMDEKQTLLAFWGSNMNEDDAGALSSALSQKYPHIESGFLDGGQAVYDLIISIE